MKNKLYVVVWTNEKGQRLYFEHEEVGMIDAKTHKTIREPQGFFSSDVKDACKFKEKWMAEAISAGYSDSHVEVLKEGERLK